MATFVPTCVNCSSNSDCTDGLACNGAETCNAGSCQTGTPVVCLGNQEPETVQIQNQARQEQSAENAGEISDARVETVTRNVACGVREKALPS